MRVVGMALQLSWEMLDLVLAHRKQVLRCAPEQVRFATSEERTLVGTPQAELLGIKDLIEGGAFKSQQYLDLVPQSYPTEQPPGCGSPEPASRAASVPAGSTFESVQSKPGSAAVPVEKPIEPNLQSEEPDASQLDSQAILSPPETPPPFQENITPHAKVPGNEVGSEASSSSYGPVRRRVSGKDGPQSIWRPAALRQDDFVDLMKEVVPKLIVDMSTAPDASMPESSKRAHEEATEPSDSCPEPPVSKARTEPATEVLSVECLNSDHLDLEVLLADYLKKKMQKELPHSNNQPSLQTKVDAGKRDEWQTLLNKGNVVRLHYGKKAREIKEKFGHRFIGSRFVLTRKAVVEEKPIDTNDPNTFTVKGRWCL